jgi:hypothetical protein
MADIITITIIMHPLIIHTDEAPIIPPVLLPGAMAMFPAHPEIILPVTEEVFGVLLVMEELFEVLPVTEGMSGVLPARG